MNSQVKSIVAHVTLVGWLIALIVNSSEKHEQTSFYLRQTLGIYLFGIIGSLIPGVRGILAILAFILWLISLIGAIQNRTNEVPVVGKLFQDWFRGI